MPGKPGIISVGKDRHLWPRELWGSRDWANELTEQAGQPLDHVPTPEPRHSFPTWELNSSKPPARGALDPRVDARLAKLGIRPRRR